MLSRITTDDQPSTLNPWLYGRLRTTFGHVEIANAGQAATAFIRGETYRVNCPFCNGTRGRLYIPHTWGTEGGSWAKCWNEECLRDSENYRDLRERVYLGLRRQDIELIREQIRPGAVNQTWDRKPVDLPGHSVPLTDLDRLHPAIEYLQGRGFDPVDLFERWGVHYCVDAPSNHVHGGARDRIIVSMREDGQTIAWQGRRVGDDPERTKYYNLAGPWKHLTVYGLDEAADWPFVVLVEGVTDVWRVGPPACATLGKWVSPTQAELIAKHFGPGTGKSGLAIVWCDELAALQAVERSYSALARLGITVWPFGVNDDRDPGEHSTAEAWQLITREINAAGFDPAALLLN